MNLLERFLGGNRTVSVHIGKDRVEVFDWGYERVVKFNGVVYSRLNAETLYTHEYWDFFAPLGFVWPRPKVLMIGLGGGTIAYQMYKLKGSAVSMEAIEVNREMVGIMQGFLKEDVPLKVTVGDGAEYVKKAQGYDIIILDAYINDLIPEQFISEEFVSDVNSALSDDGIFALNYIKSSNGYEKFDRYVETLKNLFKVYKVSVGFLTSNTILVCSKKYDKEEIFSRIKSSFSSDKDGEYVLSGYERMSEL